MNKDIVDGLKGGAIIALSAAPFAVLFGAVAVDNACKKLVHAVLRSIAAQPSAPTLAWMSDAMLGT